MQTKYLSRNIYIMSIVIYIYIFIVSTDNDMSIMIYSILVFIYCPSETVLTYIFYVSLIAFLFFSAATSTFWD